ncbi:MAG: ribosome recycling factor [Cyanobacteria bacterium SBLK]|nr:ribosome recycling factor [Cyanobacteria bacterium SBLK]
MKLTDIEGHMTKTIEATQRNFNTIRTGRANAQLLDRVMVECYGQEMPIKGVANISTPDATTILIQPYDKGNMGAIEKAITLSDLGLTPNNDGSNIRLNIPALTAERRKELVKQVGKLAEEGRVGIRNIRRDAIDTVRKQEKKHDLSEDESRDMQEQIQKLTDKYNKEIDKILAAKEKDIKTI